MFYRRTDRDLPQKKKKKKRTDRDIDNNQNLIYTAPKLNINRLLHRRYDLIPNINNTTTLGLLADLWCCIYKASTKPHISLSSRKKKKRKEKNLIFLYVFFFFDGKY